jgi:hypothetical protein
MPGRFRSLVCHEPLAQFALGGGLIFLVYSLGSTPAVETISLSPQAIEAGLAERSESLGRPLTGDERTAAIAQMVDEELLVREAYRQGVERNDAVVRSRLIEKMRFLLTGEPPVPTEGQLRAYFDANRLKFAASPQSAPPSFEDFTGVLRSQWVAQQREAALRRSLDELRKHYRIQLPAGTTD